MGASEIDSAFVEVDGEGVIMGDLTGQAKDFARFGEGGSVVIDGTVVPFVGDRSALAAIVKAMLGDDRYDELVPIYLAVAQQAIANRLYPMDKGKTWDDVPERYAYQACSIAVALISKRGAEGETSHVENGTKRTYSTADVPKELLRDIVPFAAVPR